MSHFSGDHLSEKTYCQQVAEDSGESRWSTQPPQRDTPLYRRHPFQRSQRVYEYPVNGCPSFSGSVPILRDSHFPITSSGHPAPTNCGPSLWQQFEKKEALRRGSIDNLLSEMARNKAAEKKEPEADRAIMQAFHCLDEHKRLQNQLNDSLTDHYESFQADLKRQGALDIQEKNSKRRQMRQLLQSFKANLNLHPAPPPIPPIAPISFDEEVMVDAMIHSLKPRLDEIISETLADVFHADKSVNDVMEYNLSNAGESEYEYLESASGLEVNLCIPEPSEPSPMSTPRTIELKALPDPPEPVKAPEPPPPKPKRKVSPAKTKIKTKTKVQLPSKKVVTKIKVPAGKSKSPAKTTGKSKSPAKTTGKSKSPAKTKSVVRKSSAKPVLKGLKVRA